MTFKLTRCWHCLQPFTNERPGVGMRISFGEIVLGEALTHQDCLDPACAIVKRINFIIPKSQAIMQ